MEALRAQLAERTAELSELRAYHQETLTHLAGTEEDLAKAEKERDEARAKLAQQTMLTQLEDERANDAREKLREERGVVQGIAVELQRARRAARAWKMAAKKYRKRVAPNRTAELLALQEQVEATTRRTMARAGVRLRGEDDEKGGP